MLSKSLPSPLRSSLSVSNIPSGNRVLSSLDTVSAACVAALLHLLPHECRLEQYAIDKFAESLEIIPRTLSENAGLDATETLSELYAAHAATASGDAAAGSKGDSRNMGIDVLNGGVRDVTAGEPVWDLFTTK